MSDDDYTFDSARVRLEQIAAEVRKKDTSLEKSLDLLEEGVRLANQCTELIDATQWRSTLDAAAAEGAESREVAEFVVAGPEISEETADDIPDEPAADTADDADSEDDTADSAWAGEPGHDDERS
jgi:exodeoxyribonuclease VII small subunit